MNESPGWELRPSAFDRVEVRGVSRAYGRHHALYRCDLTLQGGEAVAVVGPNGAGKTTLLRLLSTLERPTEGPATTRYDNATPCDHTSDCSPTTRCSTPS